MTPEQVQAFEEDDPVLFGDYVLALSVLSRRQAQG